MLKRLITLVLLIMCFLLLSGCYKEKTIKISGKTQSELMIEMKKALLMTGYTITYDDEKLKLLQGLKMDPGQTIGRLGGSSGALSGATLLGYYSSVPPHTKDIATISFNSDNTFLLRVEDGGSGDSYAAFNEIEEYIHNYIGLNETDNK